ncbi:Aste57867_9275 [Aphanomyces stellatus]|uniref:Aste57867_9275 protein n=1 Tax=Aphanomyces stellatus TaxID=120398 RepID=A0A485KMG2_9STRA|nr:hypothetical protein As57867_009239 [Aphanomyces stellatus]VFT86158.1 Aste57867_9275 [Aphanomyces stellatus]
MDKAHDLSTPLVDATDANEETKNRRSTHRRQMPLLHQVLLSPWEKYWQHGRIPWKLICHVLLMLCGTLQILLYDSQNSAYIRASYRNWAYFFLPNGASKATASAESESMLCLPPSPHRRRCRFEDSLFTVDDTLHAIAHVRDAYFSITHVSVATYDYHYLSDSTVQPIAMTVTQYENTTVLPPRLYNVSRASLGPFDNLNATQALALLHSLVAIEFAFPLRDIDYGPFYFDCFDWVVRLTMETVHNSHFRMRVADSSLAVCAVADVWTTLRGRFLWLNAIVLVLTLTYLVLVGRSIRRTAARLPRARALLPELKLSAINPHHALVVVTLLLLLYNAVWNISSVVVRIPLEFGHRVVQAIGPLFLWATFLGYLEHNPRFYSLVLTLRASISKVVGFLAGVSPVFFGYALFGSIVFGTRVDKFGGVQQSCVTLFALLNGDVILETFGALKRDFPILGACYLYTFVALFIYVVLNLFIAIVEESFFASRSHPRALDRLSQSVDRPRDEDGPAT